MAVVEQRKWIFDIKTGKANAETYFDEDDKHYQDTTEGLNFRKLKNILVSKGIITNKNEVEGV